MPPATWGDDVVDLPILRACGFSAAPSDAHGIRAASRLPRHTHNSGGRGAVREVCDFLLASQGRLDAMLSAYLA